MSAVRDLLEREEAARRVLEDAALSFAQAAAADDPDPIILASRKHIYIAAHAQWKAASDQFMKEHS